MIQEHLNHADIDATLQEIRCERVPEAVGQTVRYADGLAPFLCAALDHSPRPRPPAPVRQQERPRVQIATQDVVDHQLAQVRIDRQNLRLVALAYRAMVPGQSRPAITTFDVEMSATRTSQIALTRSPV